ncbi:MAG: AI-2E family transporter, partial [Tissierellia bacterium]|nr:AI-2E family transporter [Tissierellia bacterium]
MIWKIIDGPQFGTIVGKIIEPFIWAAIIAFFLNALLNALEKYFKFKHWFNILIVYLVFYGTIVLILTIVTPRLVDNMKNLAREIPHYAKQTQNWLSQTPIYMDQADRYGIFGYIRVSIDELFFQLNESIGPLINRAVNQLISLTSNFINFILGSIISIYILKDKKYFANNLNRLTYAMFPERMADSIKGVVGEIRKTFSNFLVGKLLDSLIIG